MGLIFKALFSISITGQGDRKTQGYSYDASVPSSPPIKGQYPLLGNGLKSLGNKAIQAAREQRKVIRRITTSSESTIESSTTYIPFTPQILHKIETQSTTSTSPKNWKLDHGRRSWEKDARWSRPTTSTSFVSSTLQRPTTGYIPASIQKKLRHLDSLPNESNTMLRYYHVDLLDAHSSICSSETRIQDRVQASGTRSYGEDVADRNMPPELSELPIERIETPQGSLPLIDCPELKFLKEMHLANKRAVGMTDNESTQASTSPPSKKENGNFCVYNNQVKKLSHPHSHPLRSLLGITNEVYLSAEMGTFFDRTRSYSLSKLSQPKPLPCTFSNHKAKPKDDVILLKDIDSSVSSHNQVYSSSKSYRGHSTPASKESLGSHNKYEKYRRHTYSAAVSRRMPSSQGEKSFGSRQNPQLIHCYNSLATKRSNSSLNNVLLEDVTHELNQNKSIKRVRNDENTADKKITEKNQTDVKITENLKTENSPERNEMVTSEPNHHENSQRKSPSKQDSVKTSQRRHVPFSNKNKLESKVNEVLLSRHLPDQSGLRQEPTQPYLRQEIPQKSPNYLPAEAPTVRFDRNRSMGHAENISFQEIQNNFGQMINDSADSPVITATLERTLVTEKLKNSIQKLTSLPKNMSNEIHNPIPPSKKNYTRSEALLGTQYVWHLRPLLDDNKPHSNSIHTDRGGTNIRRLSLSQNQNDSIGNNDEYCVSHQNLLSSKEENPFFGEDNFSFDFADMLPGIQIMDTLPESTFSQNA